MLNFNNFLTTRPILDLNVYNFVRAHQDLKPSLCSYPLGSQNQCRRNFFILNGIQFNFVTFYKFTLGDFLGELSDRKYQLHILLI